MSNNSFDSLRHENAEKSFHFLKLKIFLEKSLDRLHKQNINFRISKPKSPGGIMVIWCDDVTVNSDYCFVPHS